MLEHVRSNNRLSGKIMDGLNPIPPGIVGENIDRRTHKNLLRAGFQHDNIRLSRLWFDIICQISVKNERYA